MTRSKVIIFTSSFPFPPGEQFIETEVPYWSGLSWADITISTGSSTGKARYVPKDIEVCRGRKASSMQKFLCIIQAACSRMLWKEIKYLISNHKIRFSTSKAALRTTALVLYAKNQQIRLIKKHGDIDLAYCYWNHIQAYAACLIKREGLIKAVISRAHRSDLYEYEAPYLYMPLKRQFVNDFDAIYTISEDARWYLASIYGFALHRLFVSRLGVLIPEQSSRASEDGIIRILSVSFCVQVKRIDYIINIIKKACCCNLSLNIEWTHIGDGPLYDELKALAKDKLGTLGNSKYQFLGKLSNKDVIGFYKDNPIDLFINCSASEGVPVSIMEAMAHGVPAIATTVGGTQELVNEECGVLLPNNEELLVDVGVNGILRLVGENRQDYRAAARKYVKQRYNMQVNYPEFLSGLRDLMRR